MDGDRRLSRVGIAAAASIGGLTVVAIGAAGTSWFDSDPARVVAGCGDLHKIQTWRSSNRDLSELLRVGRMLQNGGVPDDIRSAIILRGLAQICQDPREQELRAPDETNRFGRFLSPER